MTAPEVEPARRFVLAQSWWIASEIARRHPFLLVIETHPGGGLYDCLTLVRRIGGSAETVISLNRNGRVHVAAGTEPITWWEAISAAGGHDVVRKLETAAGLEPAPQAPPTGPQVLTYRIVARVLASLVDDRHTWDARNGQIDSADGVFEQRAELARFSSVVAALRDQRPDDLLGAPAYRFWIVLRDQEPVAVLDTDGRLHLVDHPPTDLHQVYQRTRSLTATIGETLGHLLP